MWILAIVGQVSYSAFEFYSNSSVVGEQEFGGAEKAFVDGLKRCTCAWIVLVPTYMWCEFKGENANSSLMEKKGKKKKEKLGRE